MTSKKIEQEIKCLKLLCLKYRGTPSGSGYINTDPFYFELLKQIRLLENLK